MLPMKSNAVPINPTGTALRSGAKYAFGTNPYQRSTFAGMRGGFDPGMQSGYMGYNTNPTPGLKGLKGSCGCSSVSGCGCGSDGLSGMGQTVSLDQVIANATNWLTGMAQASLPASAAVPPGYGSAGAFATQLMSWAPYLLIGYLAYKAIK